jgi:hypothetical protein
MFFDLIVGKFSFAMQIAKFAQFAPELDPGISQSRASI